MSLKEGSISVLFEVMTDDNKPYDLLINEEYKDKIKKEFPNQKIEFKMHNFFKHCNLTENDIEIKGNQTWEDQENNNN